MAKYWQAGSAKTRLAPLLGFEHAALVQKYLVEAVVARWKSVADERAICFAPATARDQFATLVASLAPAAWQLTEQSPGDLGERLISCTSAAFHAGCQCLLLIGSDSPDLPRDYLAEAFAQLATHDIVLGPSEDGGYYLVGLSQPATTIFQSIAWSTPQVLQQTLARIAAAGLSVHLLPAWYDCDEPSDLERLMQQLARRSVADPDRAEPDLVALERKLRELREQANSQAMQQQ